ncbi:MAG: hypothetical protein ABR987_06590, partial [Terracidiphilus sp.]
MCIVAESNVMLRAQAELPVGFKVATEIFLEGWGRMRSGGVVRLEKKVRVRGWNFMRIAEGAVKSGVGATSEEAIAGALKLALRRVDSHSNAVEVQQIQLTQYPWFCLARVRVHPYRIQEGDVLPAPADVEPLPLTARERRLPQEEDELFPHFGAAMPMLKEM